MGKKLLDTSAPWYCIERIDPNACGVCHRFQDCACSPERFLELAKELKTYTHPGKPEAVMRAYRSFLLGRKSLWMGHGKGHRCLRAHMKYHDYIQEYLAAKRIVI